MEVKAAVFRKVHEPLTIETVEPVRLSSNGAKGVSSVNSKV